MLIYNLRRINLNIETWDQGNSAENSENKLTLISNDINKLVDEDMSNDKETKNELNKILTEEFINDFLKSFNSLNYKQQLDFKNSIKNILKSHKEESRFDSKYKWLLILAKNLQVDIEWPDAEPITELNNFVNNLGNSPSTKLFKPYFKSVSSDFRKATKNSEYSKDDLNILINMYIEYFSDFIKNIDDKFIIRDENGDIELAEESIGDFQDKFIWSYKKNHNFSDKKRDQLEDLMDEILVSDDSWLLGDS